MTSDRQISSARETTAQIRIAAFLRHWLIVGIVGLSARGIIIFSPSAAGDDSISTSSSTTSFEVSQRLWSFQPIRVVSPPAPKHRRWVNNPVDSFVLFKLEQNGLVPAPPAGRLALLRRAYFDLIGLPPSPDELEEFTKDERPEAFAELIERLLARPQYGERWGRHWLDVVRYADTGGFEQDFPYENAWQYRDYVIRSFNADKPFDRFVQEQVAGDEFWPDDPEAITATAVYSIGPVMQEAAMISRQLEYEWLSDAADTTGAAFLGLTFGCARCHDHKFDPISQRDYFGMQAIFAASERTYPEKIRESRIKVLNGLLAEKPLPKELENDPRCTLKTEKMAGLRLLHAETPMEVRLLSRGELNKPLDIVEPALLSTLVTGKRKPGLNHVPPKQRRAELAKWLTSPEENPLTPRVIVNRVWGWHFGQGIVRTPNDFGNQGEPPTHPELLDWLAHDFVAHGWSIKHLHRRIMLSRTYQQSSVAANTDSRTSTSGDETTVFHASASPAAVDPENRLLSHFRRQRLDAEAIWDNLHASAGTLNLKQFGPPVVPPLTADELTGLFQPEQKWNVTEGNAEHQRRGVYLFVRRTFLFPMFDAFDPPEVMTSCARRMETTVPAQALALLNSQVALEQARALATRLLRECGDNPEEILSRAWLLAYSRPITNDETNRALAFLHGRAAARKYEIASFLADSERKSDGGYDGSSLPASAPTADALIELCLALFNANEFVYID